MEFAYQGEILTPSLCGRMDQACAYGSCPVLMHYDGEFMDVEELTINGPPLHYVIVELGVGGGWGGGPNLGASCDD